jgi:hypothetical protein
MDINIISTEETVSAAATNGTIGYACKYTSKNNVLTDITGTVNKTAADGSSSFCGNFGIQVNPGTFITQTLSVSLSASDNAQIATDIPALLNAIIAKLAAAQAASETAATPAS